jgi:hypothetical protein
MKKFIEELIFELPLLSKLHGKVKHLYRKSADVQNIHAIIRAYYEANPRVSDAQPTGDISSEPAAILSPPVATSVVPDDDIKIMDSVEGMLQSYETERLYELAGKSKKNILELGSFRGKSTVALLLGAQESGNKVFTVDPFITSDCSTGGSTIVDGDADYETFMKNTGPWQERLVLYKMKSRDVAWTHGEIDVFFIDAFHTYEEVRADFFHFYSHLSRDARVAFHDYSPYKPVFPGVVKFVDELLVSGEWVWEDFRGALISIRRAPPSIDGGEVVRRNEYLKGAHQKILECLDNCKSLQGEIQRFTKRIDEAKVYDRSGLMLKGPFKSIGKHLFMAHMPQLAKIADTELIQASPLMLFEDSRVLGPPHSLHEDIENKGRGLYSHWGENLYFSTPDNTDPNLNGRNYWVLVKVQ